MGAEVFRKQLRHYHKQLMSTLELASMLTLELASVLGPSTDANSSASTLAWTLTPALPLPSVLKFLIEMMLPLPLLPARFFPRRHSSILSK